eukprot:1052110-Amorphochlora_amoeboformis.AAC.1
MVNVRLTLTIPGTETSWLPPGLASETGGIPGLAPAFISGFSPIFSGLATWGVLEMVGDGLETSGESVGEETAFAGSILWSTG